MYEALGLKRKAHTSAESESRRRALSSIPGPSSEVTE